MAHRLPVKELNEKVDAALLEADPAKRNALYADLQKEVMQKGPFAIMFQMYNIAAVRSDVKNWTWKRLPHLLRPRQQVAVAS